MCDPLRRQWLILSVLPRAPRRLDAGAIEARLRDQGVVVNRRTIQRDLIALSGIFPLQCLDATKPYTWSWTRDAASFALTEASPHILVAALSALQLPGGRLPRETEEYLRAHEMELRSGLRKAKPADDGDDACRTAAAAGWRHRG